jgi:hypothetical protein
VAELENAGHHGQGTQERIPHAEESNQAAGVNIGVILVQEGVDLLKIDVSFNFKEHLASTVYMDFLAYQSQQGKDEQLHPLSVDELSGTSLLQEIVQTGRMSAGITRAFATHVLLMNG